MPKVTPNRNFILRSVNGVRTIARKGVKIEVTDQEHRNLFSYFVEQPAKRKGPLSVS